MLKIEFFKEKLYLLTFLLFKMEEILEKLIGKYECINTYFTSVKCVLDTVRVTEFDSTARNDELSAKFTPL